MIAGDIETAYPEGHFRENSGFDFIKDAILEIGWCVDPKKVYIVPEEFLTAGQLSLQGFITSYRKGGKFEWLWQNGKFDINFLRQYGYEECGVDQDTLLISYAMEERSGYHDLEQQASDELGAPDYKDAVSEWVRGKNGSYRHIPLDIRYDYLAKDCSNTKQIFMKKYPRLQRDKLSAKLYHKVLIPASEMLANVERNGVLVDFDQVDINTEYYLEEMKGPIEIMNSWARQFGKDSVNPNSHIQMNEMLYTNLKLGKHAKSKGTAVDILEKLPEHPFVEALLKHRKLAKAYGTYVKNLKPLVSDDNRVHTSFLLHGSATGRLASRNPNMQNQPRGPRIRNQFIAPEGRMFMATDLSQAELRCLATLSKDKTLCAIYQQDGVSLHKEVSVELWGDDWKDRYGLDEPGNPIYDEAYEEYMRTKALNFGIVYGREAPSIAEEFSVTIREAQAWIDKWSDRFPDAWDFIQRCRRAPLRGQNITTTFGRRKRAGVAHRDKIRDLQNEAANFPHQSIASDITLVSAINVEDWLRKRDIKIVNLIHDDILQELPLDFDLFMEAATHVCDQMRQTPIDWGMNVVPFKSDPKIGFRWGNMKEVDLKTIDRQSFQQLMSSLK